MPGDAEEGEPVETLTGVATGPFFQLELDIGKSVLRRRGEPRLHLRMDDGETVELDLTDARCAPNLDERAKFGVLLERGLTSAFLDEAPGDHVTARVRGVRVEPGMLVAAAGVVERTRSDGEGYRDTGAARPKSMTVQALATGEDAARELAALRSKPPPRRPRPVERTRARAAPTPPKPAEKRIALWPIAIPGVPALGFLAGAAATTALEGWRSEAALGLGVFGMYFAAIAVHVAARRRFPPDLRSASEDRKGSEWRTGVKKKEWIPWTLVAITLCVAVGVAPTSAFALAVVALHALYGLVVLAVTDRRSLRRLLLVARAPVARAAGRTGALDGRVIKGSVKRTRTHVPSVYEWTESDGRSRSETSWSYADEVSASTLEMELEDGRKLVVRLGAGGVFAAEETVVRELSHIEEIGVGDRARVIGRPSEGDGGWSVSPTGHDSLFVLGSHRRSGRAAAWRALALHGTALLALAAIAVLAVARALL